MKFRRLNLTRDLNSGTILTSPLFLSLLFRRYFLLSGSGMGITRSLSNTACLAFSSTIWIFILGIAVFSIGEMTAHPKYYSYVGIVAPADKKAVYMGYAFLYGVIGSLIGSNIGGVLYEAMLKPQVGNPDAASAYRTFWLLFAALDLISMVGLILFNRYIAQDSPATNRAARGIMAGVYVLLVCIGGWFLADSVSGPSVLYKVLVQAVIMLLIGFGGIIISVKHRIATATMDKP